MSVELIRDLLKIEQTVGKEQTQALVEGEILCPESRPKIEKILNLDGKAEITKIKVIKDRLLISGEIKFDLLYKSLEEESPVNTIKARTDFNEEIDLIGAQDNMVPEVNIEIEHLEYDKSSESKVDVKAVLSIDGKIKSKNTIDVIKDIRGSEGLQVKRENIKYNHIIGNSANKILIKEAFEIKDYMPDIIDVLRINAKAFERETKVVDNKVIIGGIVELSVLYSGEDKNINNMKKEIPFTHFTELEGALKDMNSSINLNLQEPTVKINEDIEGKNRIIDFEGYINIGCEVYEQKEKEIAIDTYSVSKEYNLERQEVDVLECLANIATKETFKGSIKVIDNTDIIKNIYTVEAKPILTEHRILDNKMFIEGIIELGMLYLEEEGEEIKNSTIDMPFKTFVDIDGAEESTGAEVKVNLDNVKYSKLSSKEVEVEVSLKNNIKINRIRNISLVTNMEELDSEIDISKQPSLTVYMVQPNETIWDIAKKFNTTIDDLVSTNDIISLDNIMPGEKIIIQKKINIV
ncbi:DUF3794 domain-containing protein [Clostridiaceae bacterium M8S5]|nr:DUF3794 domain-containing protein [Clostridiaceae bacterium M8S5]